MQILLLINAIINNYEKILYYICWFLYFVFIAICYRFTMADKSMVSLFKWLIGMELTFLDCGSRNAHECEE